MRMKHVRDKRPEGGNRSYVHEDGDLDCCHCITCDVIADDTTRRLAWECKLSFANRSRLAAYINSILNGQLICAKAALKPSAPTGLHESQFVGNWTVGDAPPNRPMKSSLIIPSTSQNGLLAAHRACPSDRSSPWYGVAAVLVPNCLGNRFQL